MSNIVYLGTLLLLVCILCLPCNATVSTTTCMAHADCTTTAGISNSECSTSDGSSGYCQCVAEFYEEENNCQPKGTHGETCSTTVGDSSCLHSLKCTINMCSCTTPTLQYFHPTDNACKSRVSHGQTCSSSIGDTTCLYSLKCTNNMCSCTTPTLQYFHPTDNTCKSRVTHGQTCSSSIGDTTCLYSLKCTNNMCSCTTPTLQYFHPTDNTCKSKGTHGETCSTTVGDSSCLHSLKCTINMCSCTTPALQYFHPTDNTCKSKINVDATCNSTGPLDQCKDALSTCSQVTGGAYKCTCNSGYYNKGGTCADKLESGVTCTIDNDATECVSNAVCKTVSSDLKCTCTSGYYDDNFGNPGGQCKAEIALGGKCTVSGSADECVPYSTCTSVESDLKCQCSIGYYDNDVNTDAGTCVPEIESGVTCTRANDATECVPNAVCKSGVCTCNTGFYDDNFSTSGGQCVAEIALSVKCTQENDTAECVPNAVCQSDGSELRCTCSNDYYDSNFADSGGTCTPEKEAGVTCTRVNDATECVPNAVCKTVSSDLKCTCKTGYYDDNFDGNGGQCAAEKESGVTCTLANQPTECVPNAVCQGGVCTCKTGYYDSNFDTGGGQCIPEKESGVTCTRGNDTTECVPNAVCKSGVCTCNTGFYDDNFSTPGGQCVSELESGVTCTLSNQPTECILNAVCKSGGDTGLKCTCNSGYYDSNFANIGGSCILELQSGVTCTQNNQPTECVPNAVCENKGSGLKCYCTSNYYDSNGINPDGTCSAKILVDQGCIDNGPSDQCKDSKSQCALISGAYKCACITNYYNSAGTCTQQTDVGVACDPSQTGECKDPHSSCVPADSGHKCLCNVGYYDNNGTCTDQVLLESICTADRPDNQCKDEHAECKDATGLKCLCKDTFYKAKDGNCTKNVDLNGTCTADQPTDQCSDPAAECTSSLKCYCQNGYFENSGNDCTKKVVLNGVCKTGQSNYQCEDVNSECKMETVTSNDKCLCKNDFYANTTNVCVTKSALGEVCSNGQPVNQCSVADSECIPEAANSLVYKCFCKATFYRDVQTCKNFTGLQVQNLEVPRDTTGEVYFKITWTLPNTVAFINKFQIKITVNGGTAENLIDIVKTENQYNMTNRQPGHTYVVEVISVETASRPGEQTTSVELQAGTKPAVPNAIITNDILGPSITVSWTVGGIIQHLSGTINGTSVTPKAFNITNIPQLQTPQQQFNTVKNGERYVITVKAYSNGFTSAEFTATIRTTSTRPNPPVINTCVNQDLYEYNMNLRWKEPQVPNGDISHYIIYMSYAATRTIITDSSTEVQTIENLMPQQYYCFQMETINDAVSPQSNKSQQSPQVCCLTRAGVAEFPQNVTFIEVKSRSIKLSWMKPTDVKGVLNGYHVILRVEGVCKVEVVYQCTDCDGAQTIPYKSCEVQKKLDIDSVDANSKVVTTIDGLFPYINYEVWVAAVNGKGDGEKNETFVMTDSEVPEIPGNVVTTVQGPTVIRVNWTKPTVKPGNTTYRIKAYEVLEGKDTYVKDMTVNGYDIETVDFSGLEEYWDYKFTVTASTIRGPATSLMTAVVKTNQAPPGLVQNLNASRPQNPNNYTQMDVKWNIPKLRERNGEIKEYILRHNISGMMKAETPRTNADSDNLMETLSVATEKWYKIEVTAVNTIPKEGQTKSIMYYAEPGPPIPPTFSPVTTEVSKAVSTQRTISVELNGDWFFYNKDNGVFTDWGVIVCTGDKCDNYGDGTGTKVGNPFGLGTFKTWKQAQKTGFVEPYRATNNTWIVDRYNAAVGRRKRSSHEVEFKLGEDSDCSKREDSVYCNGPLAPGKSYIIVAFTCTAGGCTESDQLGPFPTQPEPEDVPIAIIAGAAAAVVVFIIVIIIIVVIKKKRNRNQPKKMEEEVEPDFTNPAGLETPSVERKNIKKKRPVKMIDFEAKIAELHKDSNLRFAHEYEELKTLTDPKTMKGVTTFLAETEDNKLKNRYVNILPYDHTIVKLLPLGDDDEEASTFINANYIPGYKSQREYIASQGPIPSTIDDFWRMVWEQSVSIIVMLTLAKEDGRIKCETYWPTEQSEAKQYGDIVVDMQSCSTINTYEFRIFKLTLGDKSRTLKHFHFLNWKDFSANVQNDVMVDFISNVRSHVTIPESRVPMIVHCSAGVGRTGTFIALDHMMQFIRDHDFNSVIDIFDLVVKMRECRMYMVQTEQQYIFIHDCIKDILEKKRQKELEDGEGLYGNVSNQNNQDNIYSNDAFEPDQDLYQNVDMAQPKTEL